MATNNPAPQGNFQPSQLQPATLMRISWLQGPAGIFTSLTGIYCLLYTCWIIFNWGPQQYRELIAGLGYLPPGLFAVACSIYLLRRENISQATRQAWFIIALGIALLVTRDISYVVLDLSARGVGFPDLPDASYLLGYLLTFIGLLSIPTELHDPSQKKTWVLDLLVASLSAGAVIWYFIIAPTALSGGETWLAQLVAGAYPVMDVLLLASIVRILFRKSEFNTHQSISILGAGLLVYVIGDLAYAQYILLGLYSSGSWVDLPWTFSYLLIGVAALRQTYLLPSPQADRSYQLAWWTASVPLTAQIISIAASIYAVISGNGTGLRTNGLLIGTTLTIFIVTIRQIITAQENNRLVEQLTLNANQLQTNSENLAELVLSRTKDIENQQMRLTRLQLIGEISRGSAMARNLDDLLSQSVNLIVARFNLVSVSVFLVDTNQEFITLAKTSSDAGSTTETSTIRFFMKDSGIISRVASLKEARQLQLTGYKDTNQKSYIHADALVEIALPLKVEDRILGVLDLQSKNAEIFIDEDIAILQILADQLATTIERIRLLEQVEKNLHDIEQAYGRFTREGWKTISETGLLNKSGYRFDNIRIQSISDVPELGNQAMSTGENTIVTGKASPTGKDLVAIPIKLRGQIIGVVSAVLKEGYAQNAITTLELAIERLAISLEAARLYEEARLRADREQMIAQVTTSISSAIDFDTILRTTVEEVGKSINDAEIRIQITGNPD